MTNVLLLGCGSNWSRRIKVDGRTDWSGQTLTTLDVEPTHKPDVLYDLNRTPWPFEDNLFDEVHAYEVLEHLGRQGDPESFFGTFGEVWRILKPDGRLAATVPRWGSLWAWGDPGHTRIINEGSLAFLNQQAYREQVGVTAMSDYRYVWRGDLELAWGPSFTDHQMAFTLRAVKPSRCA